MMAAWIPSREPEILCPHPSECNETQKDLEERYSQRFRRLGLCRPLIDPVGDGVAPVPAPPLGLGFLPVQHPALRLAAHPLPRSYSRIGTEPLSADTAGFLSQIRHG